MANLFNGPETTKERQAVMDFALKMEQAIGPVYSIKVNLDHSHVDIYGKCYSSRNDKSHLPSFAPPFIGVLGGLWDKCRMTALGALL